MIENLQTIVNTRHDYAKEWKKRTGGKILGYFCTYMPEEILYAADILPVRIFGAHEAETSIVEPYIYGMYCPFCRDCLAQGLKGRYDYLDGISIAQSCLHIRQTYWAWQKYIPHSFDHYLFMPCGVQGEGRYEYLKTELVRFKGALEKWTGKSITDGDLDKGIEICNENRRLLKQIWEFRKQANPAITGLEAMNIVMSSQVMDKREHNEALRQLITELPQRKLNKETGTRLMLIGSECDNRDFVKMVEQVLTMPATFVIEEHCVGSRYFWNTVVPQKDKLLSIAERYIDRPPCPQKDWPVRTRFPHIENLLKDYKVDAVVMMQQKFCDPHEMEKIPIEKLLNKDNIPHYYLEFDVTEPIGPFRIRMEAFLETMMDIV